MIQESANIMDDLDTPVEVYSRSLKKRNTLKDLTKNCTQRIIIKKISRKDFFTKFSRIFLN